MTAELDPEELEEWRTIFNLFDVDGDESITSQELGVVLRSMGQNPSDQELKEMIDDMDEDGSGTVDFEVGFILLKLSSDRLAISMTFSLLVKQIVKLELKLNTKLGLHTTHPTTNILKGSKPGRRIRFDM